MNAPSAQRRMGGRGEKRPGFDSEFLRIAQKNNWPTMAVQFAASIGVYVTARPSSPGWYDLWITIVLSISAARVVADRALGWVLSRPDTPRPWTRGWGIAHCAGLLASAGMWALLAWARLPLESATLQFTIIVILSALVGGASGVLAPLLTTGRLYIALLLGPACTRILMTIPDQTVLGFLGLVFMCVILGMHRNNHAILRRSIELGRENLVLVDRLQAQNEEIVQINRTLEARVAERTQALEASTAEAQVANRLKSEFLATVSHEIRTPLNAVLGTVQIMEGAGLEPLQRERLSVIESSSKMLLGIFNDVLDISRIEAGAMTVSPREFRLGQFLDEIAMRFQMLAEEKGLAFRLEAAAEAQGWRLGDEDRLRQILSNLISNAVKFTDQGAVRIMVDGDDETLVFRVVDTGPGIPLDAQSRIFERFVQADGSGTRRAGGLGLGLSLSRDLATMLGGTLALESASDDGACFVVTAPMPRIRGEEAEPAGAAPDAGGGRILVVDDNPANRQVLLALLGQFGFEAEAVNDGRAAVAAWAEGGWDVILMDVNMPVMDGLQATQAIRAGEAADGRPRTPIIAVTADTLSDEAATYRSAGMDDVIAKPIDIGSLVAALGRQFEVAQAA